MTSPAIIYMTSGTVSPSALAVLVPLLWGANCFAKTRIRHFRAYEAIVDARQISLSLKTGFLLSILALSKNLSDLHSPIPQCSDDALLS